MNLPSSVRAGDAIAHRPFSLQLPCQDNGSVSRIPDMTKRAAPHEAAPTLTLRSRYDARTSRSSARQAPAGKASTAPARFAVSRTTTPGATVPTSTHCPPLAVL